MSDKIRLFTLAETEEAIGVPRWRIKYAQKYHNAPEGSYKAHRETLFSIEDVASIILFFRDFKPSNKKRKEVIESHSTIFQCGTCSTIITYGKYCEECLEVIQRD